eukprot:COSAG02_NODE_47609_length_340_cov_0.634855_1_plen_46_part_10
MHISQDTCLVGAVTVYDDFGSYKSGVYWTACGLAPPLGKKCQAWGH